jgi:uncharacterized alkaline shock family protein YloU
LIKFSISPKKRKVFLAFIDVEGIVIMDRGIITTISEHTGQPVRRKSLKIKDETAATNITIWNNKVNNNR